MSRGAWAAGLRRLPLVAAGLLALPGTAPAAGAAPPKPRHIMSMMECSDLLLLMLVPRDRIASVSFLAHDAVQAILPGADRGVAVNHGAAEEVLRQAPDLILAGAYTSATARRLASTVGANVVEVGSADSFDDIRRVTRQVGQAVGEPARAEALIARMDATLAGLAASRPRRAVHVVAWTGGGSVPGGGTLTDAIITAAGADNIAGAGLGHAHGSFDIEQLLAARPDAILQGENRWDAPSLRGAEGAHPLVRTLWKGRRITFPDPLYTCGVPQSADAAVALRAALGRLPREGLRWR